MEKKAAAPAKGKAPAKSKPGRQRLIIALAAGGGGIALLIVILVVVFGGKKPPPKTPPPVASKPAESKPVAAPPPPAIVDPAQPERELFAKGQIGQALRSLERRLGDEWIPPETRERLKKARTELLQAAEDRYATILEKAHKAILEGGIAEARAMLEETITWGVAIIKSRAEKDIEGLGDVVRAAREARVEASRREREEQKRATGAAYETVAAALANVRADAPTAAADDITRAIRAAGDALWKRVETLLNGRRESVRSLRFHDMLIERPIVRVGGGEIVFAGARVEMFRRVRDLHWSEVRKCFDTITAPGPGERASLALIAMIDERYDDARDLLAKGGREGPGGEGLEKALVVAQSALEASGEERFEAAEGLHRQKRCEEARAALKPLAAAPRVRERAMRGSARCAIELRSYAGAFEDIERLTAWRYMDDDILAMVREAFNRCPLTERVIAVLQALYRNYPGRHEIAMALMSTYRQAHRYRDALEFADAALRDDPANYVLRAEARIIRELLQPDTDERQMQRAGRYLIMCRDRETARLASEMLTTAYGEYCRQFPSGRNEEIPLYVRIFATEQEMAAWLSKLGRIGTIYHEEMVRAGPMLERIGIAQAAARHLSGLLRAYVSKGSPHARTVDSRLVSGASRWAEGRASRVSSAAELERFYGELMLFSEALHFEDGLYLDALLARYGGDGDEWKRWNERNYKDLQSAVADAIANTAAVVEVYNQAVTPPVDLDAFLKALDRIAGKNDALGLAQARFLMASWRLQIGAGRTEMTEYILARLGLGKSKLFTDVTEEMRPATPLPPPPPPEPPRPGGRFVQLGAYVPELKELVLWRSEHLPHTLRHEAFHQFVDVYVRDCPPWFNEGYAEFVETSRNGVPSDNPLRQRELMEGLARLLPMRRLMALSLQEWQASSDMSLHYAQAWSFIHFLIRTGRRDRLDRYFDELMTGTAPAAALRSVFSDLDALEREWHGALGR